jgi:hypothetical protein
MHALAAGGLFVMTALARVGAGPATAATREPGLVGRRDVPSRSPAPVMQGPRSGRVLGLLLTLEALRASPALLDRSQVSASDHFSL